MTQAMTGTAAGVPYVALPPKSGPNSEAPLVVGWHLMDSPRSEAAMAAALPMNDLDSWRVYFGLPFTGSRMREGGIDDLMRRATEDAVRLVWDPMLSAAVAEFPDAVLALRSQLPIGEHPIGVFGGSAGGGIALLAAAESEVPIGAIAVVNSMITLNSVIGLNEEMFDVTYPWDNAAHEIAARYDFIERCSLIAGRGPQPAVLLVNGSNDHSTFLADAKNFHDALLSHGLPEGRLSMQSVDGLAHPLADEPGMEPAPQTPGAAVVDELFTPWLQRFVVDQAR